MKCFDPYLKADALQDSDLANLAYFGVEQVILISHAPRTFSRESELISYWEELIDREVTRFARHGIDAHVSLGVHPAAFPTRTAPGLLRNLGSLANHERVVALGELTVTEDVSRQWSLLEKQAAMAAEAKLPLLVRVTGDLKINTTYKIASKLTRQNFPADRACFCIDDLSLAESMLADGFRVMLSVGPLDLDARETGAGVRTLIAALGEEGVAERLILTSGARDGASDVLALARAVQSLERAGFSSDQIDGWAFENAARCFLGASVVFKEKGGTR